MVLRNEAATSATNALFTDDLTTMGAGYAVAPGLSPTSTCGGTLDAPPGATTIRLSNGTIPARGTCSITVPVQISGTAALGTRTNTIPAGTIQTSQGNVITPVTATLTTVAALGVAKAFDPSTVVAGQGTRLTIMVTHTPGAAPFTNVSLVDTLPPGHVVSATPLIANPCGGPVTANPGPNNIALTGGGLAAGATTCAIQVTVTAPATSGSGTNTLAAGAVTTAEGVTNGSPASATLVRIQTSVELAKSFAPDTIATGSTSAMAIVVRNTDASAVPLTGGTLADVLPAGLAVADPPSASFSGAGCSGTVTAPPGGGIVTLTGASLAVNGECTLEVQVTASTPGSLVNQVNPGEIGRAHV